MVPPPLNRLRHSHGGEENPDPGLVTPKPGMTIDDFVKSIVDQLKAELEAEKKKFSKGVVVWRKTNSPAEPWVKISDVLSYAEARELTRQLCKKNPGNRFSFQKPGDQPVVKDEDE